MAEYVDINTAIIPMNEFEQRYYHSPADVQPIGRGKWYLDGNGTLRCSECQAEALLTIGSYFDDIIFAESNFCPHCGADMRGENDGKIH